MPTSYQTEELPVKICEVQSLLTTEGNMLDSLNRGTVQVNLR